MLKYCFESPDDAADGMVRYLIAESEKCIADHGYFSLAISGGSMPELLGRAFERHSAALPHWVFCLADERYVAATHADSNERLLREHVLSSSPFSAGAGAEVLPVATDLPLAAAARRYEEALQRRFGARGLDAVLLGMGPDAHTCSLFPRHALLSATDRHVGSIEDSPKPPKERVTLLLPALQAAARRVFLVTGAGKAAAVARAFGSRDEEFPASVVCHDCGHPGTIWFLDRAAASEISQENLNNKKKKIK